MLKHKVERLEADLKEKIEEMEDAKAVLMQMDTIENIHEERERMEAMRREFVENARLAQEQIEDLQI